MGRTDHRTLSDPSSRPAIRVATSADADLLAPLAAIEAAADAGFEPFLGPRPFGDDAPPSGAERAAQDGILLVAVVPGAGDLAPPTVIGFAHVLLVDGEAHLEQLAVLPEHQGQGVGRDLVEVAAEHATVLGAARLTLRTFADVPFNGPWYARRGFTAIEPDTDLQRRLVRTERALGLLDLGARVTMTRPLTGGPVDRGIADAAGPPLWKDTP